MNQSKLDWAHAWLGGVADKPSDDAKFIEQLKQELPVLPFLGLPFAEDMIAKLEEYEPFLRGFKHMLLLGIGGCVVELLFDLLFGLTDLTQLLGSTVGDVEAAGAGVLRIQHSQRFGRIVELKIAETGLLVHLLHQRDHGLHTLEIVLQLEQLHMVGGIAVFDAAQRTADLLHLTQEHADLLVERLELFAVNGGLLHVIKLRFQFSTLFWCVETQTADLFNAEGAAAVERLQSVLQTDLFSLFKTNGDHFSASFTLMTGTSTASLMRWRNSSLSNFQP